MRVFYSILPKDEDLPAWAVKQLLEQQDMPLDRVASELGTSYQNIWQCLKSKKNRRVQGHISGILGIPVNEIWPSRYSKSA